MKKNIFKAYSVLALISMFFMSACSGGDDVNFTFAPRPSENPGAVGSGGSSGAGSPAGGASGISGSGGRSAGTGGSSVGTGGSSPSGTGGSSSGAGGSAPAAGSCEVDFDTTLILKIDDAPSDEKYGHYDSPPRCCEYTGSSLSNSNCSASTNVPAGLLASPSRGTDLYCCGAPGTSDRDVSPDVLGSGFSTEFVDPAKPLVCYSSANNRHNGDPELAAARWRPVGGQKARFRFLISPDNQTCRVFLVRDAFPQFKIENSALSASILIDMGRGYGTSAVSGSIRPELNPAEIVGDCQATPNADGGYNVRITRLPINFLVTLYQNRTQCLKVGRTDCDTFAGATSFSRYRFTTNGDNAGSYQVIPGFSNPPLQLLTENHPQPATDSMHQVPMNFVGMPLHFDSAQSRSVMRIGTSFSMPAGESIRDDNAGRGKLLIQLDNALLSAELEGVVTKAGTTTPIRTLDDLKNCSVSSGTGGSSATGTGGSSSSTGGASGSPAATGGTTGSGTGGDSGGAGSLIVGGLKIDRIDPVTEAIIPPAINTSIVFPEVPARGVPDSRLYRLSNVGTSPVTLTNLTVVDTNSNFRLFGPMQGATFATRVFPENPDSLTVPVSGGVGANDIFFFLSYGPQGSFSASTRNDTGILSYHAGSVSAVVSLTGTASNETRGQLALYVRDENRFVVTHQADLVLGTGAAEAHYYLPKSQVFSYRQDGSTDREVYLYNNAAVGSDPVVVQGISLGSHEKFRFDRTGGDLPEGCYLAPVTVMGISTPDSTGLGMRTTACAMNATLNPGQGVKLGKIIFTPGSSTTYQISSITMAVKAPTNISASLMEGRRPRIAGGDAGLGTGTVVNFGLKGVTGAPSGEKGLRINRLMAGFKDFANTEYQSSRNISSMSRGTMSRYVAARPTAMTRSIDDWKDVYTIESSATRGAVSLDPVRGTIRLTRIVSPLDRNASGDLDMNNPTPPSRYRGLRLYNSIGSSSPPSSIYYPMCKDGVDSRGVPFSCGFFYLFIGDRAGSTTPLTRAGVPAACMGKKGASAKYLTPNPDAQVLNPLRQAEYDCIKDYNLQDAIGLYDPVTGEITLRDLIVRLNAPNNPRIDVPIDTTMNLSLSTSCVSSDLVPDEEARSSGINVPQDVLNDVGVDPFIARSSTWPTPVPISTYVGNTHNSGCSNGMLHGRPLFMTADPTDTLDNAGDPMPAVIPNTFDLAGVGHLTGNNDNLKSTNLYIVIKAEILN